MYTHIKPHIHDERLFSTEIIGKSKLFREFYEFDWVFVRKGLCNWVLENYCAYSNNLNKWLRSDEKKKSILKMGVHTWNIITASLYYSQVFISIFGLPHRCYAGGSIILNLILQCFEILLVDMIFFAHIHNLQFAIDNLANSIREYSFTRFQFFHQNVHIQN